MAEIGEINLSVVLSTPSPKLKNRKSKGAASKLHGMRTMRDNRREPEFLNVRNDKNQPEERWEPEEAERGSDFTSKSKTSPKTGSWNIEAEIAKVIDIGDMIEKGNVFVPVLSKAKCEAKKADIVDSHQIGIRGMEKDKQELGGGYHRKGGKGLLEGDCSKEGNDEGRSGLLCRDGRLIQVALNQADGSHGGPYQKFKKPDIVPIGGPCQFLKDPDNVKSNTEETNKEKGDLKESEYINGREEILWLVLIKGLNRGLVVASHSISKNRSGRVRIHMLRRQNMITRSCSERDKFRQDSKDSKVRDMMGWNFENEMVILFERGMSLGCDFGKKKEMIEIIARRNEDNRFHELVKSLVLKFKPTR
ncbi:hypothetical protein Q3G72_032728 [Acer saccharum]|nr:hypothetical protein Q3G72_032728 [Acer saccharum]